MRARTIRYVESRKSVELPGSTPVVSKPSDMEWNTGVAELVAVRHSHPVLHYVANDGTEREAELSPMPLGERNGGDHVLVETEETGAKGRRRWKLAEVKI